MCKPVQPCISINPKRGGPKSRRSLSRLANEPFGGQSRHSERTLALMMTIGQLRRARVGIGKLLRARDRLRVMSRILLLSPVFFILLLTSWLDPNLLEVVQKLLPGKGFHMLSSDQVISARSKHSRDWHNLPVEASSNYTSTLVRALQQNASSTSPCYMDATNSTTLEGLPEPVQGKYILHTDKLHYLTLVAYGSNGKRRCTGGDYFEVDLHDLEDLHYRSRLPAVDYGNGTYGLELMIPSRFSGTFRVEIWLLFGNWHGMDFHPTPFVRQELMGAHEVEMVVESKRQQLFKWSVFDAAADAKARQRPLKPLRQCTAGDFDRTTWQGRWTRNWSRPGCEADGEKRFRCLADEQYQCEQPWCFGPVGRLESNGWVYSAHCSFKIFQAEEAWKCLDGRWFLMWGDSNFQDTVRNLLLFVLDWNLPAGANLADFQLTRSYESAFINPNRLDQMLRVSQVFNGAYPDSSDGEGLTTLQREEHQKLVLSHFSGERWPDTIFMNSGLHDGEQFATLEGYIESVDFAIDWWMNLYNSIPSGRRPTLVWRTTITPAGLARKMQSNPTKMEMYNQVMVEKLKQVSRELPVKIVDAFDLTFPFHYNNDFSDGGHYGRAPGVNLPPWYRNPHWYFVDVMLAHIFVNALCPAA